MQKITGTLIWYYYICLREVWRVTHELNPNQEDSFLEIGRLLGEDAYKREKENSGETKRRDRVRTQKDVLRD